MELVFAAAGIAWPVRGISTNSIAAIKSIVMNSERVTVMSPSLTEVECLAGRLRAVPLTDVAPLQPVGMMWRQQDELTPIARRFADALRLVAAQRDQL
jgi:DNA-binding transcriptional LysR family regulator